MPGRGTEKCHRRPGFTGFYSSTTTGDICSISASGSSQCRALLLLTTSRPFRLLPISVIWDFPTWLPGSRSIRNHHPPAAGTWAGSWGYQRAYQLVCQQNKSNKWSLLAHQWISVKFSSVALSWQEACYNASVRQARWIFYVLHILVAPKAAEFAC